MEEFKKWVTFERVTFERQQNPFKRDKSASVSRQTLTKWMDLRYWIKNETKQSEKKEKKRSDLLNTTNFCFLKWKEASQEFRTSFYGILLFVGAKLNWLFLCLLFINNFRFSHLKHLSLNRQSNIGRAAEAESVAVLSLFSIGPHFTACKKKHSDYEVNELLCINKKRVLDMAEKMKWMKLRAHTVQRTSKKRGSVQKGSRNKLEYCSAQSKKSTKQNASQ